MTKPCNEVCRLFEDAGVPKDIKWRGILGFLRDVGEMDCFSEKQKQMFHSLLKRILQTKDFSTAFYNTIFPEILDIYALPHKEEAFVKQQIEEKEWQLRAAEKKLFQEMLTNYLRLIEFGRSGITEKLADIDNMKVETISIIEQYEDKAKMISEVSSTAAKMMDKFVKEAAAWREKAEETDQWKKKVVALEKIASIDKLTQVYNRRSFDEQLGKLFKTARSSGEIICLLMMDIDHFKRFNDTYGHQTGDNALRIVAALMKEVAVSKGGIPARYGGEEFAVVFQSISMEDAAATAETIRDRIAKQPLPIVGASNERERIENVTVSVGVAQSLTEWWTEEKPDNSPGLTEEEEDPILHSLKAKLVAAADYALYQAKRSGRNRVVIYSVPGLQSEVGT